MTKQDYVCVTVFFDRLYISFDNESLHYTICRYSRRHCI